MKDLPLKQQQQQQIKNKKHIRNKKMMTMFTS